MAWTCDGCDGGTRVSTAWQGKEVMMIMMVMIVMMMSDGCHWPLGEEADGHP